MIDEPKQDLLVQYLLNEVDSSTAEKIRAELETDAELRDFVRETEDAFASMAFAAPPMEPPVGLSQRILQWNETSRQSLRPRRRSKIIWLAFPGRWRLVLPSPASFLLWSELDCRKEPSKSARNSWRSNKKMPRSKKSWRALREEKRPCGGPDRHLESASRGL